MIVRFCFPAEMAVSRACITSTLPRNRWKLRRTSRAVPSAVASEPIDLIAASGSGALMAVFEASSRPAIDRPRSISHVASDQRCWRHSLAISSTASSCSNDWTHRPEKQARTNSERRSESVMSELLKVWIDDGVGVESYNERLDQVDCLSCCSLDWA